jgi:hypothetical protein
MNTPIIIKTKTQVEFQTAVLAKVGARYQFKNNHGYVFGITGRPSIFTWVKVN